MQPNPGMKISKLTQAAGSIRWLVLITGLFLTLLAGCDGEQKKKQAIISEVESIAVVNNKKIQLTRFQNQLQLFLRQYGQFVADGDSLQQVKEAVINQIIEHELIVQEAARKGIKISGEELESQTTESFTPYEDANFEPFLAENHLTREVWTERFHFFLLRKKLVQKEVVDQIPVTKREIQSYLKKHKKDNIRGRAYHVSNITLSTRDAAEAVLLELKRGRKFVSLVRKLSISPDKDVDGDLGYIQRGELPEELESAVFDLGFNKGRKPISKIIHSQDGFHILKLRRYRKPIRLSQLSQREAKALVKQILIEQKQQEAYLKWLAKLRQKASISIDQAVLASEEGF